MSIKGVFSQQNSDKHPKTPSPQSTLIIDVTSFHEELHVEEANRKTHLYYIKYEGMAP